MSTKTTQISLCIHPNNWLCEQRVIPQKDDDRITSNADPDKPASLLAV